ncbi:serine hydrolase domain-containing protein [Streptomyces sp. HUAS TT20]|uniref:serine hydrolase domain-containing protein n=1 Tax=Streptomyces sp. HUAS TT20 TaxID=3447509 RepID=UPI0021D9AA5C|nr:serine hydrolase domain-containing protein [Streptomyces sp. HUAS 15-9]UXY30264.1 beta-lactamase family protein [Streptomyces sp. HUAS 15-9]
MRRIPTCVLSASEPPSVSNGHAVDRFVQIGSLTKVLTGTALMRLAAAGALTLDDPVERWLPAAPGTGITLRQLAEHTSGLPRLPPQAAGRDPYTPFDDRALRDVLNRLDSIAVRPAGQEEEYSNLGYAVLGAALAAATGTSYEELVTEHVLRPLDVAEVSADPDPARRLLAPGLFGGTRRPWTMAGPILPAGGLWATPRAAADLLVRLLVERRLGDPAPTWQTAGPLRWHNGATRDASVFAGATNDGRWVVVHRLNGDPDDTDRVGIGVLKESRQR